MVSNFTEIGHSMGREPEKGYCLLCRVLLEGEKNGIFVERKDDHRDYS